MVGATETACIWATGQLGGWVAGWLAPESGKIIREVKSVGAICPPPGRQANRLTHRWRGSQTETHPGT